MTIASLKKSWIFFLSRLKRNSQKPFDAPFNGKTEKPEVTILVKWSLLISFLSDFEGKQNT